MSPTKTDEHMLEAAESIYDGWFADRPRIDWEDFIDRLESLGWDMGGDMLSPTIRAVKAHIRKYAKEG